MLQGGIGLADVQLDAQAVSEQSKTQRQIPSEPSSHSEAKMVQKPVPGEVEFEVRLDDVVRSAALLSGVVGKVMDAEVLSVLPDAVDWRLKRSVSVSGEPLWGIEM